MAFLRRIAALTGILAVAFAAAAVTPADANHSWGKYHWARTSNPLTVSLGSNVDSRWSGHLATAAADWSASPVLETPVTAGGTTPSTCAPVQGTGQVCNYAYGANGWLGLAQIWITRGSHIAQGVAKMNDTYMGATSTYAFNNDPHRLHVMCQEVGHIFGLGHQSEDGSSQNSCMDYYKNTGETDWTSTHPNQHDYDQLAKIYNHLDRFNSSAGGASTGGTPAVFVDGHGPDGTPNGASPALGHWYIQPLGGGAFLVTHVFWH